MPSPLQRKKPATTASYESHFEETGLFEFSKIINSSLDSHFILSHILLTIMGKILSTKGMVILGKGKNTYVVETVKGFPSSICGSGITIDRVPRSAFYVAKIQPARYPWVRQLRQWGVTIVLPMYIADKPIGFLAFGERFSGKKLHSREETYLRSLANISATAIEKSRTIDELRQVNRKLDRKIQELNTLFEVGKEFSAQLDPERLVRLFVFSLLGQIGVTRYLVCLRAGADMEIAASRIDGPAPQREMLAMLAKIKTPTRVADMIVKPGMVSREVLSAMGMTVVVPIQMQGESKGVILLGEKLSKEPFSEADLEFLSSLANLAIISLENARLFKEALEKQKMEDELLIAREIQKGLLPSVIPRIPGIDIAAANISSKQVGGDYYDVITLKDGRHIIAIGDVSGKGPPAALLMANLQATIRALVPLDLPLGELTKRVNDLMCENTGGDKFITFFWGIVDHKAMTLTYVNAGHNYPYLVHAGGSMDRLDCGGMILGVMKNNSYHQCTVPLRHGDLLTLFTDGVSEAMNKNSQEYGESRLESLLLTQTHLTAEGIVEAVHHDITEHTRGAVQSDDITMMVAKVS